MPVAGPAVAVFDSIAAQVDGWPGSTVPSASPSGGNDGEPGHFSPPAVRAGNFFAAVGLNDGGPGPVMAPAGSYPGGFQEGFTDAPAKDSLPFGRFGSVPGLILAEIHFSDNAQSGPPNPSGYGFGPHAEAYLSETISALPSHGGDHVGGGIRMESLPSVLINLPILMRPLSPDSTQFVPRGGMPFPGSDPRTIENAAAPIVHAWELDYSHGPTVPDPKSSPNPATTGENAPPSIAANVSPSPNPGPNTLNPSLPTVAFAHHEPEGLVSPSVSVEAAPLVASQTTTSDLQVGRATAGPVVARTGFTQSNTSLGWTVARRSPAIPVGLAGLVNLSSRQFVNPANHARPDALNLSGEITEQATAAVVAEDEVELPVTATHGSDLLFDFLPGDVAVLGDAVDRFLDRLQVLGRPVDPNSLGDSYESRWPVVVTLGAAVLEIGRRRLLNRKSEDSAIDGIPPGSRLAGWPGSWTARIP